MNARIEKHDDSLHQVLTDHAQFGEENGYLAEASLAALRDAGV